jgi:gamma-glutamylcysteine synthetase
MARDVVDLAPIESRDELVAWFDAGAKPKAQLRVGTEHEKFAFTTDARAGALRGPPLDPLAARRHAASARLGADHGRATSSASPT